MLKLSCNSNCKPQIKNGLFQATILYRCRTKFTLPFRNRRATLSAAYQKSKKNNNPKGE